MVVVHKRPCLFSLFGEWKQRLCSLKFFFLFIDQGDSFKSKIAMFNNKSVKEAPTDPFHTEDPFKSFSGLYRFLYVIVILFMLSCCPCPCYLSCPWIYTPFRLKIYLKLTPFLKKCFVIDPFGGDPFKESDPFKGTSSEDFFKKTDKSDLFGYSDPIGRKPTPPAKVFTYLISLFCILRKSSINV